MKILKNKKVKIMLISCTAIIILSAIIISYISSYYLNKYKQNTNNIISSLIGNIQNNYPDMDKEDIIKILNNKESIDEGKELLKEFGIYENHNFIYSNNEIEGNLILSVILVIITTTVLLLIIFFIYLFNRQKDIKKISEYIGKISKKEYILDINGNTEDELDILRNELYKITVVLKEDAKISKEQKESLKNSVSDISHQLKTPLTSILILLDNLNENDNMDTATRKIFLKEITSQIENMNWLIVSLLKLSRLDSGVVEFESKEMSLNNLVNEVVTSLEIFSELKDVKLKVECNKNINICGDYNWNKEAIQNIVKNAIEHTKKGTSVNIKIKDNKVYTQIEIIDNGEGIDQKDIKHIFERFYKAKNSDENSIGIGLALSKAIIEKQNGYISVFSNKGEGTKFEIKYIK